MKTLFDAMVPSGCWGQSRGNHFIKAFARILLTAVALVGGADTKAAPFSLTLQGNSLQTTVQSGPVEAGFWPNFGQPKVDMTITVQTLAGAPVTALRFPSEGPTMPTMSYFAGGGIFHLGKFWVSAYKRGDTSRTEYTPPSYGFNPAGDLVEIAPGFETEVYSGALFYGKIYSTADGMNWATSTIPDIRLRGMAANGNTLIAAAEAGKVATSIDGGITWQSSTVQSAGGVAFARAVYERGQFAVLSQTGNPHATSVDGQNWLFVNAPYLPPVLQAGALQFSQAVYSVLENAGMATITVTRTGGSDGAISVQYATGNATGPGSATSGTDYQPASGTFNWATGNNTPQFFTVAIIDDTAAEGDETVPLSLSNPTGGATLGVPNTATLVIRDNEVSATATHAAIGYAAGRTNAVNVEITYSGPLTALAYEMTLPTGWQFSSDSTTGSASPPRANDQGTLSWLWLNPDALPMSPVRFVVQLVVPTGEVGSRSLIAAVVVGLPSGDQLRIPTSPNPLVMANLPTLHSADTDKNGQLSLQELVRVVLLRNIYRNGNNELTGDYHLVNPLPALGSDGYAAGPGDQSGRPHSADTDKNWQLSLQELVRVVLLRNSYRNGNSELTGDYHLVNPVPALGSDGFAPGPAPLVQPAAMTPMRLSGSGKSVIPAAAVIEQATQSVVATTYQPDGTVTVTCTITHNTNLFGWQTVLPTGWSLVSETSGVLLSDTGSGTADKPRANDRGTLGWIWFASPTNAPAVFSFTIRAPAPATGPQVITSSVILSTPDAQTRTVNANTLTLTSGSTLPTITQSPGNQTVTAGATATFTATASGTPAPVLLWQRSINAGTTWSNLTDGGGLAGVATGALQISGTSTAQSTHQFRLTATNSLGGVASAAATLTVNPAANQIPTISLVNVTGSYTAPGSLILTVDPRDADGTISRVEYRRDGTGVGTNTAPPYSFTFAGLTAGAHTLSALAIDNAGGSSAVVSSNVTITNALTGTLQFSSASYSAAENAGSVTITVTRVGGSSGMASLIYAASSGTAVSGTDFTPKNGSLTWGSGDATNKTFTITLLDDLLVDGNRTVNLTLSGAAGAVLGTPSTAVLTILDNDTNTVSGGVNLWAMGDNLFGQFGDGTIDSSFYPIQVIEGVVAASAGFFHSLYLKRDGTLWAMGANESGQLGDGTSTDQTDSVLIATEVIQVAGGYAHSAFVKSNGTLWVMGANDYGQLGDPSLASSSIPVRIASGVTKVVVGDSHTLFLTSNGILWGMGDNLFGALGLGADVIQQDSPAQIASGVTAMSAGAYHSHFVTINGTLMGMGYNLRGQLGNGTTVESYLPIQIQTGVRAVAAGNKFTLIQKTNGLLLAAGDNSEGQLGDGSVAQRNSPVVVGTNVSGIAAGYLHSAFTLNDGSLWTMGDNSSGQLGDGTTDSRNRPVHVATGVLAVSAGGSHTLFLKSGDVGTLPVIAGHPQSQTVVAGSNVTLSVTTTGTGLFSFWRKDGAFLPGATNLSLILTNMARSAGGSYSVVLNNISGSVTSAPALLRVLVPQRVEGGTNLHRLSDGRFQLHFRDPDGSLASDLTRIEIHSTTNFIGTGTIWVTNRTGLSVINGLIRFEDAGSTNLVRRFYRIIER